MDWGTLQNRASGPRGPGPWFSASFDSGVREDDFEGGCSGCGGPIYTGDEIRADGAGGWEHRGCEETRST